jgi:excisionase family DNA binding protein
VSEGEQKRADFYSREELARRWGLSWKTIRRMEKDGRLPGVVYIGNTIVRIPASTVEQCERHAPEKPVTQERKRTKDRRYFAPAGQGAAR